MAQDVASMGQQIAALKVSIEQLKASQDQMAQQMSRDTARIPVARTSQAKPAAAGAVDSLRAKVTAALSPRPTAPPPRKPRPVYAPQASAALPPVITAPQPAPPPLQYEPRAQAADQADGDPVIRPPLPVR
jgi:Meckel syndrome type 1 protein